MKMNDQQAPPISATRNEVFSFERGKWIPFPEWLRAHDAGVRADQAEKDAVIAETQFAARWATTYRSAGHIIAANIRRAVALTPTTEETERG